MTQRSKRPGQTSQFQVWSHFIGRVEHLQTMEELNETGVETSYQLFSSSIILLLILIQIQINISQFLTRFSTSDWFLSMLKSSTEHGSRVPVESCFGNRKQHWTNSSGKLFLLFIVTNLLPLPGLARKSMKHNFWNFWKSVSLTVKRALVETLGNRNQDGGGQNTITKIGDRLAQLKSYSRDKLRVSWQFYKYKETTGARSMYIVNMPSGQFDFVRARATGCRPISPGPDLQ